MTYFDIVTQWAVLVVVTVILILRRQLSVFHPTTFYLVFHFIVFCVRPTLIWAFDFNSVFDYMMFHPTPEVLRTTLMLSSFALVLFVAAFTTVCSSTRVFDFEEAPPVTSGMKRSFWLMALVVVPLGYYSIVGSDLKGVNVRGVFVMTGTSGYLNDLQEVFVSFVVLFAFATRWKWYSLLPLLWFVYYRAGQGYARWTMIYPFFFLILVYLWEKRRKLPPVWMLVPLPLLFFLFTNLTHDRLFVAKWIQGGDLEAPLVENSDLTFKDRWDTMDFANFDYLAYIVDSVPERTHGYNYGAQHLQLFTEPIPRALWHGKPVGSPVTLIDWKQFGNTLGITLSVVGDGWISYGWLGVAVNMILYGIVLALCYNWFVQHQHRTFRGLVFMLMCSILVQVFRDGSFVSIAKFLLFTMFPIALWWIFWRLTSHEELESLEA